MNKSSYKIIIGILLILLLGAAMIIFSMYQGNLLDTNKNISPSNSVTDTQPKSSKNDAPVSTETTNTQTELDLCIASARADAKAKQVDYADGSVLVVFNKGVSFTEALDVLSSHSLLYVGDNTDSGSFDSSGFLTAGVPKGEEFKWICLLPKDPQVKKAILNTLFPLHQ